MNKNFNPKEFMDDLTAMVEQKLGKFEQKIKNKKKEITPDLPPTETISLVAQGRTLDEQTKQVFMRELFWLMKKYGEHSLIANITPKQNGLPTQN